MKRRTNYKQTRAVFNMFNINAYNVAKFKEMKNAKPGIFQRLKETIQNQFNKLRFTRRNRKVGMNNE
jgi:hypothetical protein